MTATTDTRPATQPLPGNLADVALIDASTCASAGAMSVSWWHEEVRAGRAPKPAVRLPRCTRWTLGSVMAFWKSFAEQADPSAAEALMATAKKASAAAQAKRKSKAVPTVAAQ